MRWLRTLVVVAWIGAPMWAGSPAAADGGAFIQFDETYYLPGQTAVASSFVLIPQRKMDILERGPFYAFAVRGGSVVREGKPIPDDAALLGTLTIHNRAHDTKLGLRFVMPELPDGNYTVQVCNVPCTTSGFPQPLNGFFSIVHTARERRLLIHAQELRGTIWHLQRTVRKAHRASSASADALAQAQRQRDALIGENERLQGEITAAAANVGTARPWADLRVGLAVGIGLVAAGVVVARRRRRAPTAIRT